MPESVGVEYLIGRLVRRHHRFWRSASGAGSNVQRLGARARRRDLLVVLVSSKSVGVAVERRRVRKERRYVLGR